MKRALKKLGADEGGAALLTVLVAVMIIFIMLFEFQYGAMVDRQLAYNDLNQLQAYYLAKSGIRIGLLRLSVYGRIRHMLDMQGSNNQAVTMVKPYLELIWNIPLPAFPPQAKDMSNMTNVDKTAAEKTAKETTMTEGSCTHVITSESSKINLNYLAVTPFQVQQAAGKPLLAQPGQVPSGLFQYVGALLSNLLDNFIRESDDPNQEYGNLKPEEVVYNIMDWVSPGDASFLGGVKDGWYQQQNPPYKAKRGRMFTIDELRLVKGIDDHLYQKMKPYVTVYSYDGKINLNTATSEVYKALYPDFTDDDIKKILEERDQEGGWPSEAAFVNFVTTVMNRPGFKNIYNDANNYPFTVSSQSFVIEAMGVVKKSRSQVQRIIRASVAFTGLQGGQINRSLTTPAACSATPGMFWSQASQLCIAKPTDQMGCTNAGGSWREVGANMCCIIANIPACPNANDLKAASGTNAMKILTWTES